MKFTYMRRYLTLVLLLLFVFFPARASAHTTVPATTCQYEACDGQFPPNTTCPQGDTEWYDVKVTDSQGLYVGDLRSYSSMGGTSGNCKSFWVTLLGNTYYSAETLFTITSTERSYDCNNCNYVTQYGNVVPGHYLDAKMHGFDTVADNQNMGECFIGGFDFTDNWGVPRHFNVPTICFTD